MLVGEMGETSSGEQGRKGIGGSDISAIMGLNPWKTPYQVYQEKRKEVTKWEGNEITDYRGNA